MRHFLFEKNTSSLETKPQVTEEFLSSNLLGRFACNILVKLEGETNDC